MITYNPVLHSRIKHIDIKHYFIRDHVFKKEIRIEYISTELQTADIFTKPLPDAKFSFFRNALWLSWFILNACIEREFFCLYGRKYYQLDNTIVNRFYIFRLVEKHSPVEIIKSSWCYPTVDQYIFYIILNKRLSNIHFFNHLFMKNYFMIGYFNSLFRAFTWFEIFWNILSNCLRHVSVSRKNTYRIYVYT